MTKQEEFEMLKDNVIEKHSLYLGEIKRFSYEDVTNVHKRFKLLHAYTQAVISNAEYRSFINENSSRP